MIELSKLKQKIYIKKLISDYLNLTDRQAVERVLTLQILNFML